MSKGSKISDYFSRVKENITAVVESAIS